MREEQHAERSDEAMSEEKPTWEKPALKVFFIDDTAYRGGADVDAEAGSYVYR